MPTVIYCDRVKHRVHQDVERLVQILDEGDPEFIRVTPLEGALPGVNHIFLRASAITSFHAEPRRVTPLKATQPATMSGVIPGAGLSYTVTAPDPCRVEVNGHEIVNTLTVNVDGRKIAETVKRMDDDEAARA